MFNAANGKTASDKHIENLSDCFAADFEDVINDPSVSREQKEQLIEKLSVVVANRDTAKSFAAGTYTQNSQGQPAAAIGAGASGQQGRPSTEQEALAFLLASGGLPTGVKQALKRLLNTQDPAHIAVGADGTPTEVGQLRQELATKVTDLREIQDPTKAGSLAKQLADAQAAAAPTGFAKKSEVRTDVEEVRRLAAAISADFVGKKVTGRKAVTDKIDEILRKLT